MSVLPRYVFRNSFFEPNYLKLSKPTLHRGGVYLSNCTKQILHIILIL